MGIWADAHKKNIGIEIREEDKKLTIINNRDNHNKEVFTEQQITLFNRIVAAADDVFAIYAPESEIYNKDGRFISIPINLVPETTFLAEIGTRCKTSFAGKMRRSYDNERARIPQNIKPEERERLERRIKAKYGPWLCPAWGSCTGECTAALSTPLGYYVPDDAGGKIYICYDKIVDSYPAEEVVAIVAKVILHELGHAIMFNPDHRQYETAFEYWAEESLANKIALRYLAMASISLKKPELYEYAKAMVSKQDNPYKLGLYLDEHNALDFASLRDNKNNINEVLADRWVDEAAEQITGQRDVPFHEFQCLFFRALDKTVLTVPAATGFEAWLYTPSSGIKCKQKNYLAFVTSPYMGTVIKEMIGWSYNTVSECQSSVEVETLIDRLEAKRKSTLAVDRNFNLATFGGALSSLNKYKEYLLASGL